MWVLAQGVGIPRLRHLPGHRILRGAFTKCGRAIGGSAAESELVPCAVCEIEEKMQARVAQLELAG